MFGNKADVQDIRYAEIKRTYTVKGKEVCVRIQNGMTGLVDGKSVILDEVLINNMLDEIVQVVKKNHSKYNLIPQEIIMRNASYKNVDVKVKEEQTNDETQSEQKIVESYEPRFALEQIALNSSVREQIKTTEQQKKDFGLE